MKIGCCVSLWEELALQLPAAGADYAEGGFSSLRDKTLAQVKSRAGQLAGAGLDTPVMNLLFPGDFQLTGPQAEFSTVDRYLEENLPKAAVFGVKTLVFGSGGARRVPEGFPQEEAFAQLVELCRDHIAPAVEAQGMGVLPGAPAAGRVQHPHQQPGGLPAGAGGGPARRSAAGGPFPF